MTVSDYLVFSGLLAAILAVRFLFPEQRDRQAVALSDGGGPMVFLFRNGQLRDLSPAARALLPRRATSLDDLLEFLSDAFPELDGTQVRQANFDITGTNDGWRITSEQTQGILRVTVHGLHEITQARTARDLGLLDQIASGAPQLIWQQSVSGRVLWSNAAYRSTVAALAPTDGALFPALDTHQPSTATRLKANGSEERWFDVTTTLLDHRLTCFATETTELVRADENRREYVKTLGRTFGDLSTGLAIFDKERRLKMFNPALLEMSNLPFAFLSTRPRIDTVFDRMREIQMMPEPKDYASWREQFTAVETGAKQGTYCENWPLPDGQTFRVTGRPHPDGAFALLFEDITAEVSLTRRFRTEIETGQAVLDSLPDALAVFARTGTLVMQNAAYATLWGCGDHHFEHRTIATEVVRWQDNSIPSPAWSMLQDIAQHTEERQNWIGDALLLDGRPMRCQAIPLDGGMTLIRFTLPHSVRPIVQKLTQRDPAIRRRIR